MNKNLVVPSTGPSSGLTGGLRVAVVVLATCALVGGCDEKKPATAKQPADAPAANGQSKPAQQTASVTPTNTAPTTAAQPAQPTTAPTAQPTTAANTTAPPTPAPPPPPPVLPFDQAVSNAAHAVFSKAPPPSGNSVVVIDPLVDGVTGYQSKATKSIQDQITSIVKADFPQYAVQSITPESLKQQPRVLVGTFTPVNSEMKTAGVREAYRFCLVMGDLSTGKVVAKSVARARIGDVDATPTAIFADSPVWTPDPSIQAYIATCQASKVGDALKSEYVDGLLTAATVSEAVEAYDNGRYSEALDLYRTALKSSAGEQLRVYNGIYMSLNKLGRSDQNAAFKELVDYGIQRKRLAVMFLFRPGSVRFATTDPLSSSYDMWLEQISTEAVATKTCLQITGHTSPTGTAALNDSLSLARAEYIQSRLEEDQPQLKKRTVAKGKGSQENMIGTGKDDKSDQLDRRVEMNPIDPCN